MDAHTVGVPSMTPVVKLNVTPLGSGGEMLHDSTIPEFTVGVTGVGNAALSVHVIGCVAA